MLRILGKAQIPLVASQCVRPLRTFFSKSSRNLPNTPAIDAHYNGITPIVGNSIVEENNVGRGSPTLGTATSQQTTVTHTSQIFKFLSFQVFKFQVFKFQVSSFQASSPATSQQTTVTHTSQIFKFDQIDTLH